MVFYHLKFLILLLGDSSSDWGFLIWIGFGSSLDWKLE